MSNQVSPSIPTVPDDTPAQPSPPQPQQQQQQQPPPLRLFSLRSVWAVLMIAGLFALGVSVMLPSI